MGTSLGGIGQVGLRLQVVNATASTIKRGTGVAFSSAVGGAAAPAVIFTDGVMALDYGAGNVQHMDIPLIPVSLPPAGGTVAGDSTVIGFAAHDILSAKAGEIINYGMVRCLAGGTVLVGAVLSCNATGKVVDTGLTTDRNPIGICAQGAFVDQLAWVFVNCLAGGCSAAFFMGRTIA